MLYSKLAFVLAVASSVTAQSITDIPSCALTPALNAIGGTGCATTDFVCICKQTSFLTSLNSAIQQVCSADDYATTVEIAQALCLQNGVTLVIPSAASTAPAASGSPTSVAVATTGAASGSASGAASSAASASASGAASSAAASASASGSAPAASGSTSKAAVATTTSPSAAASGGNSVTGTATSKPAAATSNGAAVKGTWAAAGLLGVGALLAAL